jgi:hypothetical protein
MFVSRKNKNRLFSVLGRGSTDLLTTLDTQSWAKELVTGNAQFIEISAGSPPASTIYVVSNVRADNSFAVLQSIPTPPASGPGAGFIAVATYTFPRTNSSFDPVVAYDPILGLLHIIGTQDNALNPRYSDLIKFTFNTNTQTLSGPITLTTASAVRDGYDMVVLGNGHRLVAVSLLDATMMGAEVPPLFQAPITYVEISTIVGPPDETLLTVTANNTFSDGQLVTLTGLTTATFLNGAAVQVISATPTQFQAAYTTDYPAYSAADTGLATPFYSGENLIAFELDTNDAYVTGSLYVVASSPDRSGDTFSAVSLVTTDGVNIELYYGAHPKVYTFKDQLFTINLVERTAGSPPSTGWGTSVNLFTFTSRYADDSLTVIPDSFGNRYLSWSFWTQSNNPEGITGNVMLGTLQAGNPWLFNPLYGSSLSGSIVQATLSVTQFGSVSLAYLLEPFTAVLPLPVQGTVPAYPLFVADVVPSTLGLTNVAGWYNQQVFTWLRGTNSNIDDASTWAFVGEAAELITVTNESQTIPASGVVQVNNFSDTPFANFWENIGVIYALGGPLGGTPLVEVQTAPLQGQYQIEPTNGRYIFNLADVGAGVQISYTYVGMILPVYVSLFNVPPVVVTPYPLCGPPLVVYRDTGSTLGQPFTLNASSTFDADQDAIEYWWSDNDTTGFVTLTPSDQWTPSNTSVLSVSPAIGGAAETFNVGVAAVDLYPDLVTQRHPPLNVMGYQILLGTLDVPQMVEFTVSNTAVGNPPIDTPTLPLAVGEEIMTWDIMSCSPPALVPQLNDQVWYVVASTPTTFTAVPLCGMSGSPPAPPPPSPPLSPVTTELGVAANYAVLAYSGVTNTGNTVITGGDVGSSPTPAITGFPPAIVVPPAIIDNADAGAAQTAALAAYNYYSTLPSGTIISSVSSQTFTPGTYTALSTLLFTGGTVTLNGAGVYIFQVGSALNVTTGPTTFVLTNGATADDVIFVVGSAASFDANQATGSFVGTIIAQAGISFVGGTLTGRALSTGADVTFAAAEIINVPASVAPPIGPICATGYAIPQFQFAVITIVVPYNAPPQIVFPEPEWEFLGSPPVLTLATTVARNTQITISPNVPLSPPSANQFPVEYFGISDPDDVVTYSWTQVSGTPVTVVGASNLPSFTFDTNGAAIQGETLVFSLTLCDSVNPCDTVQFSIPVAGYPFLQGQDSLQLSRSVYSGNVSQRNQSGTWGPVDISILFNNLVSIKRNSVNDGTDRYIVISPLSVLVYGGIYLSSDNPMVLLRKLLTPNGTLIVDAVHTEDDYTLVLDDAGNIFRYTTASFIYTDNPDTTIVLSTVSNFTFNRILTTFSYGGQRVLLLGGPDGVLLLQVANSNLQITGILEISIASNLLYGANNVQFIRTAGVESLKTGQVLIGSILNAQATITGVSTINNLLTVIAANDFKVNDTVTLSGLTTAKEFNGQTFQIIASSTAWFQASTVPIGAYGTTLTLSSVATSVGNNTIYTGTITGGGGNALAGGQVTILGFGAPQNNGTFAIVGSTPTTLTVVFSEAITESAAATGTIAAPETGLATATNDGQTYETLISLSNGIIIGTWNSSKLINQFVNTGEILFQPNSEYTGYPLPPVLLQPVATVNAQGTTVAISWTQQRPDLVTSYTVQFGTDGVSFSQLQTVGSGAILGISVQLTPGQTYYFRVQAFSLDGPSNYSNVMSISI